MAIASLVLGIIGLILSVIGFLGIPGFIGIALSIVAIILGAIAMKKNAPHRGCAVGGLVCGIIGLVLGVILTVVCWVCVVLIADEVNSLVSVAAALI